MMSTCFDPDDINLFGHTKIAHGVKQFFYCHENSRLKSAKKNKNNKNNNNNNNKNNKVTLRTASSRLKNQQIGNICETNTAVKIVGNWH